MPAKKPLDPLPLTPTTTTSQQATSLPPEWVDADTTPPPEVLEQPVLPGKQITTWTATPEPHVHTKIGDAVQRVFEAINKIALFDPIQVKTVQGKHAVRLYAYGTWRRIFVDSLYPSPNIFAEGNTAVQKAFYKMHPVSPTPAQLVTALTGWTAETLVLTPQLLQTIKSYNVQNLPPPPSAPTAPVTQQQSMASLPLSVRSPSRGSVSGLANAASRPDYNRNTMPQWARGPEYLVIMFRNEETARTERLIDVTAKDETEEFKLQDLTLPTQAAAQEQEQEQDYFPSQEAWYTIDYLIKNFSHVHILQNPASLPFQKQISFLAADPPKTPYIIGIRFFGSLDLAIDALLEGGNILAQFSGDGSLSIEPFDWKSVKAVPTLQKVRSGTFSIQCDVPQQLIVDSAKGYHISFYSKEDFSVEEQSKYLEKTSIIYKDVEETVSKTQPFKQIFHFKQATLMAIHPLLLPSASLIRIFDNDTSTELESILPIPIPTTYETPEKGYTILVESASKVPVKLRLRYIMEAPGEFDPPMKPVIQEIEEPYIPNKGNILFRYVLKLKDAISNYASFQLHLSENVNIQFQLLESDREVCNVIGKEYVNIPLALIEQSGADPLSKKDPKTVDKKLTGKRRYVLQATVIDDKFSLNYTPNPGSLAFAAGRPSSSSSAINSKTAAKDNKKNEKDKAVKNPEPSERKTSIYSPAAPDSVTPENRTTSWKLRIISSEGSTMTLTKDTEKDEKLKALKESWESSQPGRAVKARDVRELYLRSCLDSGKIIAIPPTFPPGSDAILDPFMGAFASWLDAQRSQRVTERSARLASRVGFITRVDAARAARVKLWQKDLALREAYRQKRLREMEDIRREAEEARIKAELAAKAVEGGGLTNTMEGAEGRAKTRTAKKGK